MLSYRVVLLLTTLPLLAAATPVALAAGTTERVSVSSRGVQGNGNSGSSTPAISADGRFVAFDSVATNLVPGAANGGVFVRDRKRGTTTELVSNAYNPAISADGRFVGFDSGATNLVPGATNGGVFVRDRERGTTELVSVSSGGKPSNDGGGLGSIGISADGRFVAFSSGATNLVPGTGSFGGRVFVRDRERGTTELVSVSSGGVAGGCCSFDAAISADGRFVAFDSFTNNLVPGDTNGERSCGPDVPSCGEDVFVRDRKLGTTERVSVSSGGKQGNNNSYYTAISADGRVVAFSSDASNLVPGDTNGKADVFVHTR